MKPVFFRRDCWFVGITMGIVLPALFYFVLFLANKLVIIGFDLSITKEHHFLYLLSFIINLFPLRYYLSKLKYEKTGLGILIATIAGIILYFYMFYKPE